MNDPHPESVADREPLNPYAPPAEGPPRSKSRAQSVPSRWLVVYAVAQAVAVLLDVAVMADVLPPKETFTVVLWVRIVSAIAGAAWLGRQWQRLPYRLQMVRGRGVTPTHAALRNLIPVYNVYWVFAVNGALCNRINEGLATKGQPRLAPVALSTLCPATLFLMRPLGLLLDLRGLVAATFGIAIFWGLYMLRVEQALSRMTRKAGK